MKTHVDIDQRVLADVQQMGGLATKREAVHAALTEMARRLAARQLLEMRGHFEIEADPPTLRESRFPDGDNSDAAPR